MEFIVPSSLLVSLAHSQTSTQGDTNEQPGGEGCWYGSVAYTLGYIQGVENGLEDSLIC